MISDEAVEAAAKALLRIVRPAHPNWDEWTEDGQDMYRSQAIELLEAAAPHMLAALVADLDRWAGRSKPGFYDEAQDDVVQILNPYRSQS